MPAHHAKYFVILNLNRHEEIMPIRMTVFILSFACLMTIGECRAVLSERGKSDKTGLQLVAGGQTEYVIVKSGKSTDVDEYPFKTPTYLTVN